MALNIEQAAGDLLGRGALNSPQTFFTPVAMGAGEDVTEFYGVMDRALADEMGARAYQKGVLQSEADALVAQRNLDAARMENEVVPALQELDYTDHDFRNKLAKFESFAPYSKIVNNIMDKKAKDHREFVTRMGTAAGLAAMSGMDDTGVRTTLDTLRGFLRSRDVGSTSALMGRIALGAQVAAQERAELPKTEAATLSYERQLGRDEAQREENRLAAERSREAMDQRQKQQNAFNLLGKQREALTEFQEKEIDILNLISPELRDDKVYGPILKNPFGWVKPEFNEAGQVIDIGEHPLPISGEPQYISPEFQKGIKYEPQLKGLVRKIVKNKIKIFPEDSKEGEWFAGLEGAEGGREKFEERLIDAVYTATNKEDLFSRLVKIIPDNEDGGLDAKALMDKVAQADPEDKIPMMGIAFGHEASRRGTEIPAQYRQTTNFLLGVFEEVQNVKELLNLNALYRKNPLFGEDLNRFVRDSMKAEKARRAAGGKAAGGKEPTQAKKEADEDEAKRVHEGAFNVIDNPNIAWA